MTRVVFLVCVHFFFFFSFALGRQESDIVSSEDSKVVVPLSTESVLLPLYIAPLFVEDSEFDAMYHRQLEEVLRFDFAHNGRTQLVSSTKEREDQAAKERFNGYYDRMAWRNLSILYVVKIQIRGKNLSAGVFSIRDYNVKSITGISLSGNISIDRRQIHQLVDCIHKEFFDCGGIAGTRLLYALKTREKNRDSSKWVSEIWECDCDGANARRLTYEKGFCVTPAYLPPKEGYASGNFFYVSYRLGQPKIFVASFRERVGRRFSYLRGNQLMPAVSSDQNSVAFICDVGGNPDLFLQPYHPKAGCIGKPRQIFASPRGAQASPSFSPDGKRLAFVSDKDGAPRIYVLNVPASGSKSESVNPILITKCNRENTCPVWSPDGKKLAYSSMTYGVRQIWIYDFVKQEESQLTHGGYYHRENPSWAPNGLHIVFNAGNESVSELYIVNLNQPEAVKISSGEGEKRFPCWEPRLE